MFKLKKDESVLGRRFFSGNNLILFSCFTITTDILIFVFYIDTRSFVIGIVLF